MKRSSHIFQFIGNDIAKAAQGEAAYHFERVAHWKERQSAAIFKAKQAGVEVREFDVTGGKRVDVVLDPTVTLELNLCAAKINDHQAKADRFQIEAAAYSTQAMRTFELDPDDVIYFRLAGNPRPNDA